MRVLVATAVHASLTSEDPQTLLRLATCNDPRATAPRAPSLGLCFEGVGFEPWGIQSMHMDEHCDDERELERERALRVREEELAASLGMRTNK